MPCKLYLQVANTACDLFWRPLQRLLSKQAAQPICTPYPTQPNPTLQVLKLSKEKWDEARDHAMRAVVADNRMRIWCVCRGQGRQAQVRLLLLPDLLMQYAHA